MTMPTFLVIGAPKCGTTALYHFLISHPQVFMSSLKEPHFFAFEGQKPDYRGPKDHWFNDVSVVDLEGYRALFEEVRNEKAVGEVSPNYLYYPQAPQRIKKHIPRAKLIAILRHPADRAYSAYSQLRRDGREPLENFTDALAAEHRRRADNWSPIWHYTELGYYHRQLRRFYKQFDRSQIKAYLYEDLEQHPLAFIRDVYNFLEIDTKFTPNLNLRVNVSGVPRSALVDGFYKFLTKPHPVKPLLKPLVPLKLRKKIISLLSSAIEKYNLDRPKMSDDIRRTLTEQYVDDIRQLQELIGRDLTPWLEPTV